MLLTTKAWGTPGVELPLIRPMLLSAIVLLTIRKGAWIPLVEALSVIPMPTLLPAIRLSNTWAAGALGPEVASMMPTPPSMMMLRSITALVLLVRTAVLVRL